VRLNLHGKHSFANLQHTIKYVDDRLGALLGTKMVIRFYLSKSKMSKSKMSKSEMLKFKMSKSKMLKFEMLKSEMLKSEMSNVKL
jgi:hypothetical protein